MVLIHLFCCTLFPFCVMHLMNYAFVLEFIFIYKPETVKKKEMMDKIRSREAEMKLKFPIIFSRMESLNVATNSRVECRRSRRRYVVI